MRPGSWNTHTGSGPHATEEKHQNNEKQTEANDNKGNLRKRGRPNQTKAKRNTKAKQTKPFQGIADQPKAKRTKAILTHMKQTKQISKDAIPGEVCLPIKFEPLRMGH